MTEEYRLTQLASAEGKLIAARQRFDSARTKKSRREAAEDIEFWGNKAAFLNNPNLTH